MTRPCRPWRATATGIALLGMAVTACSSPKLTASPRPAAPGILSGSVTIGSYQPLTGAAAPGAQEIAPASAAYFRYLNAHGGIYGRTVIPKYLNDQSNPALAPSIVHKLVQQDSVLAIFNASGVTAHLAVAPFLASAQVPDVFAGSGCPCWDSSTTLPQPSAGSSTT